MESFYKNEYRNELEDIFVEKEINEMSNEKALELLLLFSLPIQEAGPVSKRLLSHFKSFKNVMNADFEELIAVGGMNRDSAVLISLANSLSNRARLDDGRPAVTALKNKDDSRRFFEKQLKYQKRSRLYTAALDEKLNIISVGELKGDFSLKSADSIKSIVKLAKDEKASSVIIGYNSADDNIFPDGEIKAFVKELKAELNNSLISLNDVIVVGKEETLAFSGDLRLALYL